MPIPVLVTAPTVDLLTLKEAKNHCRVDTSDDDEFIDGLIASVTSYLDGYAGVLGRALLQQTWKMEHANFSADLCIPLGNVLSVDAVKYYDTNNTQQTASASLYELVLEPGSAEVCLKYGQSWPVAYMRRDAIEVTWKAGYGTTAASVPSAIRHAALLLLGHWYNNRGAATDTPFSELPMGVAASLAPHRIRKF